jgi:pimeloyl-ACP methyl ester carboxylesterase
MININQANFDKQFKHQTAEVNGVHVHYVIGGQGEAVVLLHGFPQTWYEWHRVMPALAAEYTVIAPDLRGLGESSRPASDYEAQNVAEDIHQLVQSLGFDTINLVAHDIAGAPAYAYAVQYPQEVGRLVMIETLAPGFVADNGGDAGKYWHMGFHMTPDLPELLIAGKERDYLKWFFNAFTANPDALTEDEIEQYVCAYSKNGAMHTAFEYYRAMPKAAEQNRRNFNGKLEMPVLALGGELVMGDLPLNSLRLVAEDVRGGAILGSGHWVASERFDDLVQHLLTFFSEVVTPHQTPDC